ncbi:5669_t:CDS:1, partial [Cetraspora pellucida]
KDISEAKNNVEQQIIQLLNSHNLTSSDLPPQYQNWEEQLLKLTSEKEINDFRIALEREIKEQARLAIALSNESKNNKQNV